jgi:glycosyltransferase involved in cell wall biosynthesis
MSFDMRILQIIPEHLASQQAGISRHGYDLSQALAIFGHEVHVVTAPPPFDGYQSHQTPYRLHAVRTVSPSHATSISMPEMQALLLAEAICVIKDYGLPDLLHVHGHFNASLGAALKILWKIPLVVTSHYTEVGLPAALGTNTTNSNNAKMERWLLQLADLIICPSHSLYQEIRVHYKMPSHKMIIIPNGVQLDDRSCLTELVHVRDVLAKRNDSIILYAGRLSPEKGPHVLLEAFYRLSKSFPLARLVFVGSGAQYPALQKKVKQWGLIGRVTFTDHLAPKELRHLYSICDLLVMPSLYEVFGLVAVEAMSFGVPVIASDIGGLGEIIIHDETGMLVPPGDPSALAETLKMILSDSDLALRLACGGREFVEKCFSWKNVVPMIESAYRRLAGKCEKVSC